VKAQHTLKYWAKRAMSGALPRGVFERIDRTRRWRRYRAARVVFVHVPKAAGSGIATTLYGGRLGHHPAARLMCEDPAGWAAFEKFAVVREPVERFLSAFAFAMSAGTGEGAIRWRPEYERPEFRDVNAFVLDYLARGDILDKDIVFWPQSHFVCDAAGRPVAGLRLFAMERFEAVESFLAARGHACPPRMNRGQPAARLNLDLGDSARSQLAGIYRRDFAWYPRPGAGA
jgi:Sulfotransferase family